MARKGAKLSDVKIELELHLDKISRLYGSKRIVNESQVKRLSNLKGRLLDIKAKASYL